MCSRIFLRFVAPRQEPNGSPKYSSACHAAWMVLLHLQHGLPRYRASEQNLGGDAEGGGDRRAERAYARSWRRSALPVHFRALSAQEHDHFSGLSGGLGQIAGECMRRDSAPFLRLAWAREWDVWQLSTPVGCSRRGRPDTVSTRSSPSRRSPPSRYPGICHAAIRLRYFLWYAEAGMWHK